MKKLVSIILCLVLALSLLTVSAEEPVKVALILTGAAEDGGWNQCAYDGLKLLAANYNCETAYTEYCTTADMFSAVVGYAEAGYDIIFGHSNEFGDPMTEAAELYPDVCFVAIEGSDCNGSNFSSYQLDTPQTAYVTGMLAALVSKTGVIGMVAPIPSASLVKLCNGFEDGAKATNPDIDVKVAYTNSYIDVAAGREAAIAMIEVGADVIAHCANDSGLGAINAAVERNVYCTGDSFDQSFLAPELMLTSAIYNVDKLMDKAYNDMLNGTFDGSIVAGGIADQICELANYNELIVPEEVRIAVNQTIKAIIDGDLVIVADTNLR